MSEWLSDVILGDPEAGMRLLYHPTGDTTRLIKYIRMLSVFTQSISRLIKAGQEAGEYCCANEAREGQAFLCAHVPLHDDDPAIDNGAEQVGSLG